MKTVHKKMLFTAIVGFSAGIAHSLLPYLLEHTGFSFLAFITSLISASLILATPLHKHDFFTRLTIYIIMVAVSPIGITVASLFLNVPLVFIDYAELYALFGFTLVCLLYLRFSETAPPVYDEPLTVCLTCKTRHPKRFAFCPECQTLSPEVHRTFEHFPNKKNFDYIPNRSKRTHIPCCPHCDQRINPSNPRTSGSIMPTAIILDTPIRQCNFCKWFFINPAYCEWTLMSKWDRLRFFFRPQPVPIVLLVCALNIATEYNHPLFNAISFIIWAISSVIWLCIDIPDKINASKARVKNNPEYPKLLKHMGYENFISRDIT